MQKNWNKIESIYGTHDSHLIHFIEVNKNNSIHLIHILFPSFRIYQDYLLVKNELKKFE